MLQCNIDIVIRYQERDMSEYGDIFDYQLSATAFEWLNLGFMAAYGLFVLCLAALPAGSASGRPRFRRVGAS
jgi:hypothetical protein